MKSLLGNISIIMVLFILIGTTPCFAEEGTENLDALVDGTKSDLLMVIGGGLAGAVLGLSTLSFVDEPKEHTQNIIMGASLGIIAGVIFVALSQATKHRDNIYSEGFEDEEEGAYLQSIKDFSTSERLVWHVNNVTPDTNMISTPYQIGYSFAY